MIPLQQIAAVANFRKPRASGDDPAVGNIIFGVAK